MTPYFEDGQVTIYHGDALDVLPQIGGVDCIFTDPPYFRVKGDWWDRQWDTADGFICWLAGVADEWRRMLAMNGSLYCFASPKMAARVEVMLAQRFAVLNRIRWIKDAGWHKKADAEAQRRYLSPWEEIIFAEQYGQDTAALGGWTAKCDELRGFVFEPIRAYLDAERVRAGVSREQIEKATQTQMFGHWFSRVQWALPTAQHYRTLRGLFNGDAGNEHLRREYEDLRREYEDLRREYEHLRREYEDLRRPFNSPDVPLVDVWGFSPVMNHAGKHPCEKPIELVAYALRTSTNEGALVLDCFAGSGATLVAARSLGRRAIGIEIEERYCEIAAKRLSQTTLGLAA